MDNVGAGTPAPDQGQVGQQTPAAPDQGQAQPSVNWEAQYNELRPEYTRATQRLSEYEQLFEALQDPEHQAEILSQLGLELDTGPGDEGIEDPDEWVDPLEQKYNELEQELEGLKSERELEAQQAQEEELLEMRDAYIDDALEYIADSLDLRFSEKEEEVLGNLAIAMAEDGVPDVQGAYNALYGEGESVLEVNRQRWIDSKTGAIQAPRGAAVSADKRPTNRRERIAYIDERMRALEQQQ